MSVHVDDVFMAGMPDIFKKIKEMINIRSIYKIPGK